mgnify:CR=1 FL=1
MRRNNGSNRYLKNRMSMNYDGRRMRDSRGRYTSDRGMHDMERERDSMMYDGNYHNDYPYERDYRMRDMRRDYGEVEDEYYEDLEKWCKELKRHDRFGLPKEEIINQAHSMGVQFRDYDEIEFITTYYMMMSDYPEAFGNYQGYLALAKGFLEDQDAELQGSEKLCAYMYTIVKGE